MATLRLVIHAFVSELEKKAYVMTLSSVDTPPQKTNKEKFFTLVKNLRTPDIYLYKLARIRNLFLSRGKIISGPFKGIRVGNVLNCQLAHRRLLGTDELELHPVIEELNTMKFDTIINVGAAEGYYIIGFTMLHPESNVVAFELNPKSREKMRKMLRINSKADAVDIRGICEIDGLRETLPEAGTNLVFMDVEGAELELLSLTEVPQLSNTYIVVETHDFIIPNASTTIAERFESTHDIISIPSRKRTIDDFPLKPSFPLSLIPEKYDMMAMLDRQEFQVWYFMKPKAIHQK